jgi:hypothetical protein
LSLGLVQFANFAAEVRRLAVAAPLRRPARRRLPAAREVPGHANCMETPQEIAAPC